MSNIYKDLSQVLKTQLDVSEGTCFFLQLPCFNSRRFQNMVFCFEYSWQRKEFL
jgi:hypothetical protein